MHIINLTPHSITVGDKTFPPSGQLARCEEMWDDSISFGDEVNILRGFRYGKTNLPEPDGKTHYIVSLPVILAEPTRTDLFISVGQLRDAEGKIIGAQGLAHYNF